jgi:hypothetical protein
VTWSAPQAIADNCWAADDMATSAGGWIVVTANCYTPRSGGDATPQATLIVRRPDGIWEAPVRLDIPDWYGAEGVVAVVGDGDNARAVVLRFGLLDRPNAQVYLVSKRLADSGGWEIVARDIIPPSDLSGAHHLHAAGLAFPRALPDGSVRWGVTFTWVGDSVTGAWALTSLDGGLSWGSAEPIVFHPGASLGRGFTVGWAVPSYDPAADRLIAIWTCCAEATYTSAPSTHYASWSVPGSGVWFPNQLPGSSDPLIPVVLGSRSAWTTASAQGINARVVWVAWVEQGNQIHARTLNLNQIIPADAYPTPTVPPTPTSMGETP